jgi:CRISPR-associated protein Cmr3
MQIFIEPSDVLLFRDGRPFSAGEGHRARSIFPPTPNTIQGVIRSKILADRCGRYQQYRDGCLDCSEQNNCTIPDEIGKPDKNGRGNYGKMNLKGALISKYHESKLTAYFPIPADVVQVKDKDNPAAEPKLEYLQPLRLQQNPPGQNDLAHDLSLLWTSETKPVEAISDYFTHQELQKYLLGEIPTDFMKTSKLYERESRFGIEVDNSKQIVQEGRLYQTEFIRCDKNIGLYVEIDGIQRLSDDPNSQLVAIGGENRVASYSEVNQIDWGDLQKQLISKLKVSAGFKLYLATPTVFKQGWLPEWIDSLNFIGNYHGIEVKLVATAIGRYQTIGGWDVAYNRPKPTNRAVSAGSVYYFTTDASPEDIFKVFHWQNFADDNDDARIGFGLGLIGTWNYCTL